MEEEELAVQPADGRAREIAAPTALNVGAVNTTPVAAGCGKRVQGTSAGHGGPRPRQSQPKPVTHHPHVQPLTQQQGTELPN